MRKWIAIALAGFCSASLAANLPECSNSTIDKAVNTIESDVTINSTADHMKALVREYPQVKNCSALQQDMCTISNRYNQIYADMQCDITTVQSAKLNKALASTVNKDYSASDLVSAAQYSKECFPDGNINCSSKAASKEELSRAQAFVTVHWDRIFNYN